MKIIFIVILIIVFVIVFLYKKHEFFNYKNNKINVDNPFNDKLPNIFFTKQFINNLFVPPKPKVSNLDLININSYIDSNIITNKIICSSITNQAACWDNNNCQWNRNIGKKSYCEIAPKFLL